MSDDSEDGDDTPSSSDESDLGLHDVENHDDFGDDQGNDEGDDGQEGAKSRSSYGKNPIGQLKNYNENKKGLHRTQRGLMQWKPMRNLAFAKDEAKFAARRAMKLGRLSGRQPDVETET
jgi:hypothetical protein